MLAKGYMWMGCSFFSIKLHEKEWFSLKSSLKIILIVIEV